MRLKNKPLQISLFFIPIFIPVLLLALAGCGGGDSPSAIAALTIFRASMAGSIEANNNSRTPSINDSGQFIAFSSDATTLLTSGSDTNGFSDIYLYNKSNRRNTRVSVASGGTQANNNSLNPSISGDGRYIAFASDATNLIGAGNDTNGVTDIFLHDRLANVTTRVSVATGGMEGDNNSTNPAISANGQFIAFASDSTNLIGAGADTNGFRDIFVHDRLTGVTTRVSVATGGTEGDNNSRTPSISSDGRFVAFASDATNLIGVGGDINGFTDIFVNDSTTGITTRVSVSSAAVAGNNASLSPSISSTGQFIAFASDATNLLGAGGDTNIAKDIFFHDSGTAVTTRVSVGPGGAEANSGSLEPAISANGWLVVFSSSATNLLGAGGDTNAAQDVFLYDRTTGVTARLSQAADGTQANNNSQAPAISGDGLFSAFSSDAGNLLGAGGDTNGFRDIFVAPN